jgi:hypothetical protein
MPRDMINTLYTIQGLTLLGIFMIGFGDPTRWVSAAYYIAIPLFLISFLISLLSLMMKSTKPYRDTLKRFVWWNYTMLILLIIFVYWANGGSIDV